MSKITQLSQLDLSKTYSYANYMTWWFDERVELINGKVMLLPTPNVQHQRISMNLSVCLFNFFQSKQSEAFAAPFDVRLYDRKKFTLESQHIHTVVQPDLCVIRSPSLLDEQGSNGAPDWIIEILSPGNSKREMKIKYNLYQESGVNEYWLVYPSEHAIYQFVLEDAQAYQLKNMYSDDDIAIPHLFPDLTINVTDIFAGQT